MGWIFTFPVVSPDEQMFHEDALQLKLFILCPTAGHQGEVLVSAQVVSHPVMQEGLRNIVQDRTGGGRTRDCGPAGDSVLVPLSCRIIRARGKGDVGGHWGSSCQDADPPHLPPGPHVSSI